MSPQSHDLIAFLHALEELFERYRDGLLDTRELRRIEARCANATRAQAQERAGVPRAPDDPVTSPPY
jgi:hypothetical protein